MPAAGAGAFVPGGALLAAAARDTRTASAKSAAARAMASRQGAGTCIQTHCALNRRVTAMLTDTPQSRLQALKMLQSGRLDEARDVYESLIAAAPDDADLVGRMAQLALLEKRLTEAEELLRRSLRLDCAPGIRLRNLYELGMMLHAAGRNSEMLDLARAEAPEWPEAIPADKAWRPIALWLVDALSRGGEWARARRILDRALPNRAGDVDALSLDGRLALAEGDHDAAVRIASTLVRLGQHETARALVNHIIRKWAGYIDPSRPSHRATILVCNPATSVLGNLPTDLRTLHFRENFVGTFARRMQDEFRFISVFADILDGPLPPPVRLADVVLSNFSNAERLGAEGLVDALRKQIDATGLPVINHPDLVARTTREDNCRVLENVPGLKVPRVERFRVEGLPIEEMASRVAARFDFPVIVRRPLAQSSSGSLLTEDKTALLVHDRKALYAHLERSGWSDFYAVEYVDLKRPDGFYRKLRCFVIDGRVMVTQAAMYHEWMVSGWRTKPEGIAFYRANPKTIEECNRIMREPEAQLGAPVLRVLDAIAERIPLDIFGVDFEVDREGRVVFFEATPAMVYRARREEQPLDVRVPEEPLLVFEDAFRALVARRMAETSASSD